MKVGAGLGFASDDRWENGDFWLLLVFRGMDFGRIRFSEVGFVCRSWKRSAVVGAVMVMFLEGED